MGKIVEKKRKKKKKGRPSLLDLQKRSIKEQQQQQEQQKQKEQKHANKRNSTPNSATPTPLRRSTRRNPNPEETPTDQLDGDVSVGRRREKRLNLVIQSNSGSSNSQSNAEGRNDALSSKKRKIDAIGDGSGVGACEEGERSKSGPSTHQGNQELGPSTPLPDKKLLLFILERLQKKDTYGVFSEPVDPEELPDYHEIIDHPMDFGTVRKKLDRGAYANLEEFEKDVFLISSNAMEYNAPDTVYFRQACAIEELAKKSFLNLRQDSDDEGAETKIVRRGRPPTKNVNKPPARPPSEHVGSIVGSNAVLTGEQRSVVSNNDTRKGFVPDNMHNNDAYAGWMIKNRCDRNDESSGQMGKSFAVKPGQQQFVSEESKRSTYFHPNSHGQGPLLSIIGRERKQLMAVGVFSEHGYAKSLARFAANLGPAVWKLASKKIEQSLPAGVKFGPGWVGENDMPQQPSPLATRLDGYLSLPKNLDLTGIPSSELTPCEIVEEKALEMPEQRFPEKQVPSTVTMECHPSTCPSQSAASSSVGGMDKALEAGVANPEASGSYSHGISNNIANDVGLKKAISMFQKHQSPLSHPGANGLNGFNLPPQMANLIGASRPNGFNLQPSQMLSAMSRICSNNVHTAVMTSSKDVSSSAEDSEAKPSLPQPNSGSIVSEASTSGINPEPHWQGSSQQQKPELRSPRSCQPDLALQL